jgi:hypothetical protein
LDFLFLLDERWHVAEASFTDPILHHFARTFPAMDALLPASFGVDRPFHPLASVSGTDPFADPVFLSITPAMARRSSFDADQLELLNLVTDTLQPPVTQESAWMRRAHERSAQDPVDGLRMALAAAMTIAAELRDHYRETPA